MFVPEKFKTQIYERFDVNNAIKIGNIYVIPIPCPLCELFYTEDCEGCPFESYEYRCDGFMMEHGILPRVVNITVNNLWWAEEDMREAIEWFLRVRDILDSHITWVKEV